jgi:glycosyltransferase involved in cell wall biosynthesis
VAAGADVVRHERNRGYDAALGSGFARAAALQLENVVTMDADGQHNPLLLQQFIDELDKGVDIVLGVRDRRQRFAEHAFAWIAQRLWSIKDPLCGMKGYDMDVYRQLGHFDSYRSIGTELAIFAARRGLEITQIPVKTAERIGAPRFGRRIVGNLRILRALFLGICRSSKHARSQ